MFDFLLILFFSKTILLTPDYVNIEPSNYGYTIDLKEPINAVTTGASIQIDITEMLPPFSKGDLFKVRRAISEMFPDSSIEATLTSEGSKTIRLRYQGYSLIGNETASLKLSRNEIPTGVDFKTITIKTDVKLERVKISWRNFQK